MIKKFKNYEENLNSLDENWEDYKTERMTFDNRKKDLKHKISDILRIYDEFTKDVSPKHWRTTGHHYTELKKILEEVENFTEMTEEERIAYKKYIDK